MTDRPAAAAGIPEHGDDAPGRRRGISLRASLVMLLSVLAAVGFVVVGGVLLTVRVPQLTAEARAHLRQEALDFTHGAETQLGAMQAQIDLVATALTIAPHLDMQSLLGRAVADGTGFEAVYQVGADGKIARIAVHQDVGPRRGAEVLGNDLSGNFLATSVRRTRTSAWSDKHPSPVTGVITVAIGVPAGPDVLIGEIPLAFMLKTLHVASGSQDSRIWVVDGRGEILADSENPARVGVVNIANQPLLKAAIEEGSANGRLEFEGEEFDAAAAHSRLLDWVVIIRSPGGLANPRVAGTLELGLAALVGTMLIGLLLSPLWATWLARPISAITERARRIAAGEPVGAWPRSRTIELNDLSHNIELMAASVQEREQELAAIFDASPVGIGLLDPATDYRFLRVNEALVQLLGYPRETLLGRTGLDLGFWVDVADRRRLYHLLERDGRGETEGWLRCRNGSEILASISTRTVTIGSRPQTIWVAKDITQLRAIEDEVRSLNVELEQRVQQRTEQLRLANAELSATIDQLQIARDELVRTEKLASLGSLVAGIAHELNTPIGNGLMSVSTMRNALSVFEKQLQQGVRRSDLERFTEAVGTGTDIASRNLTRAAELVTSFKQVAVDQTSSQRRRFDLHDVVAEILLTLHPVLKRSGCEVRVDIPAGLVLDSYPGPLGQVLANLINNALLHAFDEQAGGHLHITAAAVGSDHLRLEVGDDGKGIAADLLPRIFDPFVTTRMGTGGTGLGLHIAHNIVAGALGGTIRVFSQPGEGCRFEIDLPRVAPTEPDGGDGAAAGTLG